MKEPEGFTALLLDPRATDILINGPSRIYVDRGDGAVPAVQPDGAPVVFAGALELRAWVQAELAKAGKSWDARYPFVDARLESGHRAQVTFPPVTSETLLVSLRRPAEERPAEKRWSGPAWERLASVVERGESLLVCGATGSGKTTLANDLLSLVPARERVIALEDTPELRPAHPHFLSLVTRAANADGFGEVTLRDLLRQSLRMRPDRIVLGECRGGEVLELLQALNTGHRGTIATLHANSPRDAIRRVELLCLLGGAGRLPLPVARELVSGGIRWIAHVRREEAGRRRIAELASIEGREGEAILLRPHPV